MLYINKFDAFFAVKPEVSGRFLTDAVTVYPGCPTIFTPEDPLAVPVFTSRVFTPRDLHSAIHGG